MNYVIERLGLTEMSDYIIELPTQLVVAGPMKSLESRPLQKHLNSGGGFMGWTPEFLLQRLEISEEQGNI